MFALALLAAAGFIAGYVNAIAGAGSLLTLPALIFSGLDPGAANATNRIAILFQNIASIVGYRRGGAVASGAILWICLPAAFGAGLGAWIATMLEPGVLRIAIAVVMVVMLPLTFIRPPDERRHADDPVPVTPGLLAGFFVLGMYAGFIQVGVGILILLFLAGVFRVNLVSANALKVVVILALTVVAIGVFAGRQETIDLQRGAVLAISTSSGGYLGARAAIQRGEAFVRAAVVVAVLVSAVVLLAEAL